MARLATAVTNYQTNNNGQLPKAGVAKAPVESAAEGSWPQGCEAANSVSDNSACNMIRTYMNASGATKNEFKDPNGNSYGLTIINGTEGYTAPTTYDRQAYIITGVHCSDDGTGGVKATNNKRDYVITFMTEGSGLYCSNG